MIIGSIIAIFTAIFMSGLLYKYHRQLSIIKLDNERMAECILGEGQKELPAKEIKLLSKGKPKEEMFINFLEEANITSIENYLIVPQDRKKWKTFCVNYDTFIYYPTEYSSVRTDNNFSFGIRKTYSTTISYIGLGSKLSLIALEIIDKKVMEFLLNNK